MRYLVVVEQGTASFGAYVPESGLYRGCRNQGRSLALIREAIEFHLEGLREEGAPIPQPHSSSELIEIDARGLCG